jgi:hypothetical protein
MSQRPYYSRLLKTTQDYSRLEANDSRRHVTQRKSCVTRYFTEDTKRLFIRRVKRNTHE